MRYVLPTAPIVCSYTTLAKINGQISTCLTIDTGFYFHKTFFVLKPNFEIFCRNTLEKNVKNTCFSLAPCLLLSSTTL